MKGVLRKTLSDRNRDIAFVNKNVAAKEVDGSCGYYRDTAAYKEATAHRLTQTAAVLK